MYFKLHLCIALHNITSPWNKCYVMYVKMFTRYVMNTVYVMYAIYKVCSERPRSLSNGWLWNSWTFDRISFHFCISRRFLGMTQFLRVVRTWTRHHLALWQGTKMESLWIHSVRTLWNVPVGLLRDHVAWSLVGFSQSHTVVVVVLMVMMMTRFMSMTHCSTVSGWFCSSWVSFLVTLTDYLSFISASRVWAILWLAKALYIYNLSYAAYVNWGYVALYGMLT